jgi:hypothetical protein
VRELKIATGFEVFIDCMTEKKEKGEIAYEIYKVDGIPFKYDKSIVANR